MNRPPGWTRDRALPCAASCAGWPGEGKAIVVSSHVLAELDEIADGAVFVNQGRSVLAQSVDAGRRAGAQVLHRGT